ncbi:MAG: hypothetical protein HYU02_08630, partial [Thaumarchaeota archaeon]|nr:hypothetical protein [Nitrososphaerota archaeon]
RMSGTEALVRVYAEASSDGIRRERHCFGVRQHLCNHIQ